MHYLITGHTGFKGAWMIVLLKSLGHKVSGLSLDPLPGALFEIADLATHLEHDIRGDIRSADVVAEAFNRTKPDVVIHMAAQPLVLASYEDPVGTYDTNVMGTLRILNEIAKSKTIKASLIVTTDKVYKNVNRPEGYLEEDSLGGDDPYSSSKAMADILTQAWVKSFPDNPIAIARAGNVIGGGDVNPNRLLPDLLKAINSDKPVELRNPRAIRPWQHVLDCLYGYQLLIQELLAGRGLGEWNFGPGEESFVSVSKVVADAQNYLGLSENWRKTHGSRHEAQILALNSSKARLDLNWENQLKYPTCLEWTVDWAVQVEHSNSPFETTLLQVERYLKSAQTLAPKD